MKRLFIQLALLAVALLALSVAYSTLHGYTTWWFWRRAVVTVDGKPAGYLHRPRNGPAVIITRTDTWPHQSYLVSVSGPRFLIHCGVWSAPRFLAFPIGDVNQPCSAFSNGADDPNADNAVFRTLVVQARSVEFTTNSGKRIKARW